MSFFSVRSKPNHMLRTAFLLLIATSTILINKSFEWQDLISNNRWEPLKGEALVNMCIRGLIPTIK